MVISILSGHTLSSFLISRRKYSRSSSSFCGSGACERCVCIPYLTESSFSRLSEKLSSCKRPELCRAAMFGVTMSRCHARWGGCGRVTMLAHSALGGEAARWPMYDRGSRGPRTGLVFTFPQPAQAQVCRRYAVTGGGSVYATYYHCIHHAASQDTLYCCPYKLINFNQER